MTGVHIMLAEWSPSSPSLALSMPSGDVKNGVSKRPNWRRVEALHAIVVAVH